MKNICSGKSSILHIINFLVKLLQLDFSHDYLSVPWNNLIVVFMLKVRVVLVLLLQVN